MLSLAAALQRHNNINLSHCRSIPVRRSRACAISDSELIGVPSRWSFFDVVLPALEHKCTPRSTDHANVVWASWSADWCHYVALVDSPAHLRNTFPLFINAYDTLLLAALDKHMRIYSHLQLTQCSLAHGVISQETTWGTGVNTFVPGSDNVPCVSTHSFSLQRLPLSDACWRKSRNCQKTPALNDNLHWDTLTVSLQVHNRRMTQLHSSLIYNSSWTIATCMSKQCSQMRKLPRLPYSLCITISFWNVVLLSLLKLIWNILFFRIVWHQVQPQSHFTAGVTHATANRKTEMLEMPNFIRYTIDSSKTVTLTWSWSSSSLNARHHIWQPMCIHMSVSRHLLSMCRRHTPHCLRCQFRVCTDEYYAAIVATLDTPCS